MSLFGGASLRKNGAFLRRFADDTAGSELVEFALCISLLLMVIFGIVDGSRIVYAHHFVAGAAEAGVRYASTRGSTWPGTCTNTSGSNCAASAANITSFVMQSATIGVAPANLTVAPTWPGATPDGDACNSDGIPNATGCLVTVNVSYVFQFTLPFLPNLTTRMSSSASGVIQQ